MTPKKVAELFQSPPYSCTIIGQNPIEIGHFFHEILPQVEDFNLFRDRIEWKESRITTLPIQTSSDLLKLRSLYRDEHIIVIGDFPFMRELQSFGFHNLEWVE